MRPAHTHRGFTLIELSIVLVIIGLLTAGILVGSDLIHAARVRATVGQIENYKTAVNAFRLKFNCLPGDCADAVAMGLGSAGGAGDNGNGDGFIWELDATAGLTSEGYNFWHHLSRANLIAGNYAGYTGQVTTTVNIDYPATKLGKGGFWFASPKFESYNNLHHGLTAPNKNSLWISAIRGSHPAGVEDGILQPMENYQIDTKIDDGLPVSGSILLSRWGGTSWFSVLDTTAGGVPVYGASGATSNFCGADNTTPPSYNIVNVSNHTRTLCVLQISGF
jgi:prepilin-type N-terminal cleavage/methylation domain-containing protein